METIDSDELKAKLEEEMAKYEEEGYFKRLVKMFKGLSRPRSTPEYKEAMVELQRQIAPLLAFLLPAIFVVILFVVTANQGNENEEIRVDLVKADVEEDVKEEEPPPEVEPPPDMDVDVQVDTPSLSTADAPTDAPQPTTEPVTVKSSDMTAMLNVKSPVTFTSVMGSDRSTGVRAAQTNGGAGYGDAQTEAAVLRALRWLKAIQMPNGSWGGRKPELGLVRGIEPAAGTGFAILTFLAHGETPASEEFGETVKKGLDYLVNAVYVVKDKKGNLVKDVNGETPFVKMAGATGAEYGFLIGTYALCETYGMTQNPNAKTAAELALGRIIRGQTATGGWNYNMKRNNQPDAPDDISFGGWALQAIKAGKMAGLHVEGMQECIKKAVKCLQTRNYTERGGFAYRATTNHKMGGGGLAGVGCLAMQLLGYSKEPQVKNALNVMKDWEPWGAGVEDLNRKYKYDTVRAKVEEVKYPFMKGGTLHNPQYYCYYASQCKYQAGMCNGALPVNATAWKKWNQLMKERYPKQIRIIKDKAGKAITIKDAKGRDREMGRWESLDSYNYDVMGTCLAALQLMVYYRYLPTTTLKATEVEPDVESLSKDKTGEVGVTIDI